MNVENFAILIRSNGKTGQLKLTAGEQRMFSQLVLGTLTDTYGKAQIIETPSIDLPANTLVFKESNHE